MKIVISNLHLCEFGGSELVSVELAEFYASLGHEVLLYSPKISAPLIQSIKRDNITLTVKKPSKEELYVYDIVWSHHGLLLDVVNSKNKKPHQLIVSNHMSSWVREEFPKYAFDEVDIILANSEETRATMGEAHRAKCQLFQNPCVAPQWSDKNPMRAKPFALNISNHRPADLMAKMAEYSFKIDFELLGLKTQNYLRLNSQKLYDIKPDFVICNGKSVQYCLAAGVPVFLYDNMGGCGWLTEENFCTAEWHNFSGRGFSEKPNLDSLLNFDKVEPIIMTESRNKKFLLNERIKELGLY